jgi:hypothetical protein
MEVSGQLQASTALPMGKAPGTDLRLGGPRSLSGRYGKETILTLSWNRTTAVQSVGRRYIDRAISTPLISISKLKFASAI